MKAYLNVRLDKQATCVVDYVYNGLQPPLGCALILLPRIRVQLRKDKSVKVKNLSHFVPPTLRGAPLPALQEPLR